MADNKDDTSKVLPPEVKAYRNDAKFRRFCGIMRISVPKMRLDKIEIDGEEARRLAWGTAQDKQLFNDAAQQDSTTALKDIFQKWTLTKQAWRDHPSAISNPCKVLGIAPSFYKKDDNDKAEQSHQSDHPKHDATGAYFWLFAVLLFSLYIYSNWPLWRTFMDPDSSEHYHNLGLESGAGLEAIKKAKKEMYLKYHPDKLQHTATQADHDRFEQIKESYKHLLEIQKDDDFVSNDIKDGSRDVLLFIEVMTDKIFTTSFQGAEFISMLLVTHNVNIAAFLQSGLLVLFLLDFGVGINSVVLLFRGTRYIKNMWQGTSVAVYPDYHHIRYETKYYLLFFIVPATLYYLYFTVYLSWNLMTPVHAMKLLMGLGWSASFIIRHRPYLFLNFGLCSLAYKGGNPVFQRSVILGLRIPLYIRVPFELALDDISAYAMHVPPSFRVACITIMVLSFIQNLMYPAMGVLQWGDAKKFDKTMQEILDVQNIVDQSTEKQLAAQSKKLGKVVDQDLKLQKQAVDAKEKKQIRKQDIADSHKVRTVYWVALGIAMGIAVVVVLLYYMEEFRKNNPGKSFTFKMPEFDYTSGAYGEEETY
eukprot:TRINITY_DN18438_c0_g1_i1.p1 TRINITY_DN18438_c0_g1~~TRINITY_DN18438_c0_g1_i1.p1  ORF type:complete len:589 (+),score=84.34 TRINITY_DN18438_c0_g1_i1:35-1801(+)